MKTIECCCCDTAGHSNDCVICGKPLVYFNETKPLRCEICHQEKPANAACEDGHFVCDECHAGGGAEILGFLRQSKEKNPIVLYLQVCALNSVHLHGPEHHRIVPCVLVTAYHNCGGDIEFEECLGEAWDRGKKVPGGACGFLGVCGAAAGAGIFTSILCDATPLTETVWNIPQKTTMETLRRITEVGGCRCCKRTGRLSIEAAVESFIRRYTKVEIPLTQPTCTFSGKNRECLRERCPYFKGAR